MANKQGFYKKGHTPWNKNLKGIHLSPQSEFHKGQKGVNWVPVGSTKVRIFHGKLRTYQKVAEPNKWKLRSIALWESLNGKLPKGHIVHHKDRDVLNDDISNLELLSRAEHMKEHRAEFEHKRLQGVQSMRRSPMTCQTCGTGFIATKKAKYCPPCAKQRIKESSRRYKLKVKTKHLV